MSSHEGTPPGVLVRDLFIFHFKLALDGIKGVMMIWMTVVAVIIDLALGGRSRGKRFYAVIRLGERFDLWLNLYGAARNAETNPDGFFGESRAGDDTFLGEMEGLVRKEEPAPARTYRAAPAAPASIGGKPW